MVMAKRLPGRRTALLSTDYDMGERPEALVILSQRVVLRRARSANGQSAPNIIDTYPI